jgi:hypothetical protein
MMEMIKSFLPGKEVSSEKRDERKKWQEKEDSIKSFYEIQTKKLEIGEIKAHAPAKEVDNRKNELEIALLIE